MRVTEHYVKEVHSLKGHTALAIARSISICESHTRHRPGGVRIAPARSVFMNDERSVGLQAIFRPQ
jgi:hypothetical protein